MSDFFHGFIYFLRFFRGAALLFCAFGPLIFPAAGISIEPLPFFPLDLSTNSLWLWCCVLFGALPYGLGVLLLKYSRGRGLRWLGHLLTVFPLVMAGLVFRNYGWGGSLLLATPFFLLTRKCTSQEVLSWLEELLLHGNLPLDSESRDRWVKEVLESGGGEAAIRQELLKRLEEETARRAEALSSPPSPSSTLYQDLCELVAAHPVATALLVATAVAAVVFCVGMGKGSGPSDAGGDVAAAASAPLRPRRAVTLNEVKAHWEGHIRSLLYKDPEEFGRLHTEFETLFSLELEVDDVRGQELAQTRWEAYVQAREAARQHLMPEAQALYRAEVRNQQELVTLLRANPEGLSREEVLALAYAQLQKTIEANPAPEAVRLLFGTEKLHFIPQIVFALRHMGNPAAEAQADYIESMLPGITTFIG